MKFKKFTQESLSQVGALLDLFEKMSTNPQLVHLLSCHESEIELSHPVPLSVLRFFDYLRSDGYAGARLKDLDGIFSSISMLSIPFRTFEAQLIDDEAERLPSRFYDLFAGTEPFGVLEFEDKKWIMVEKFKPFRARKYAQFTIVSTEFVDPTK